MRQKKTSSGLRLDVGTVGPRHSKTLLAHIHSLSSPAWSLRKKNCSIKKQNQQKRVKPAFMYLTKTVKKKKGSSILIEGQSCVPAAKNCHFKQEDESFDFISNRRRRVTNPLAEQRVSAAVLLAVFVQGGGGQRHRGDGLADAVYLHSRQFLLLALRHQAVELGGAVADQSSQVAHKLVDEALALHLADHVAVVVVPERGGGKS